MKRYFKIISIATAAIIFMAGCSKKNIVSDVPANIGTTLTATQTSVVISNANANSPALNLQWTDPKLSSISSTDSSNIKYMVQIDTAGGNFLTATRKIVYGIRDTSFTGQELNDILVAYGFPYGVAVNMAVRVSASYANNDDILYSNTLAIPMTPSAVTPFNLAATSTGPFAPTISNKDQTATTLSWNVPTTATSLTYVLQYDSTGKNFANVHEMSLGTSVTSSNITNLNANVFAQQCGIAYGSQGKIDVRIKAVSTINPAQIQYSSLATLTITPQSMIIYWALPGTYQGWNNSTPLLASTDLINFEGYVYVPAGTSDGFKIVPVLGDWSLAYGDGGGDYWTPLSGGSVGAGTGGGNLNSSGGNIVWPGAPASGMYYCFQATTTTWSARAIASLSVIGDFNGWGGDVPMTYNASTGLWTATVNFTGSGGFKIRENNDWGKAYGVTSGNSVSTSGNNIPSPATAGQYIVTLDLSHPLNYTYSIQ